MTVTLAAESRTLKSFQLALEKGDVEILRESLTDNVSYDFSEQLEGGLFQRLCGKADVCAYFQKRFNVEGVKWANLAWYEDTVNWAGPWKWTKLHSVTNGGCKAVILGGSPGGQTSYVEVSIANNGLISHILEVTMTYKVPRLALTEASNRHYPPFASFTHEGKDSDLELITERFGNRGLIAAGIEASRLCMDELARSSDEGRVPISGAVVTALPDGRLKVQTRINGTRGYHNCRIPGPRHSPSPDFQPDFDPNLYQGDAVEFQGANIGYPTDHGETGSIRQIDLFGEVDWSRTVFTTSLSPCVMCTRMFEGLYQYHGLRNIVVLQAKSNSFKSQVPRLQALDGSPDAPIQPEVPKGESAADKKMEVVCLENKIGRQAMDLFSCRYANDWNADIGAVAPRQNYYGAIMEKVHENAKFWLAELSDGEAAVYGPDPYYKDNREGPFQIRRLAVCRDSRSHLGEDVGDNPCRASVIKAMGTAGSAVNLQECAVLWKAPYGNATTKSFSSASWGAVELFKPAVVVVPSEEAKVLLQGMLQDQNIENEKEGFHPTKVVCVQPQIAPPPPQNLSSRALRKPVEVAKRFNVCARFGF
jgi:hypothetical protein